MWQSSGKYVPRVDQLVRVAPAIIDMGCFDRVETNGGAFEQVNLLFGENPNRAVREWTAPFHKAGAPIVVTRPVVEVPEFDLEGLMKKFPDAVPLQAPAKGKMLWQIDVVDDSLAPSAGTAVKAGQAAGYVQTFYGMEEILSAVDGRIVAVTAAQGADVVKGQIVALAVR